MTSLPTIQEIMGPVSLSKVTLSPPWLLNEDDQDQLRRQMIQEYKRPQTTLKAVRLSVAHAAISTQRLVFTLGERTLEGVIRGDPNWIHFSGELPKFTKSNLGRYYKELEGLGLTSLTRARPHGKVAPIFYISQNSPLRRLIHSDFDKQLKEAWEFATPLEEDIRDPELTAKHLLIPRKCQNKGLSQWNKEKLKPLLLSDQNEALEQEKDQEKDLESFLDSFSNHPGSFLQLGIAPLEVRNAQ